MLAEIITIGDEILIGQIVDTNSAWIAKRLNDIGVRIKQITSVSDDKSHIVEALNAAIIRADIIMITGGLGPTKDDITKKTLAEYFGVGFKRDQETLAHVENIFLRTNRPMLEINMRQADVPENCTVLLNKNGTAPGMWFDENGKTFISMPGVPFEMMYLVDEQVIPRLKEKYKLPVIIHHTILTAGIGESYLAQQIEKIEDSLPPHIKLAYLPKLGQVRLRLSGYGDDKDLLDSEILQYIKQIVDKVGEHVVTDVDLPLEKVILNLMESKGKTLAFAESCTGGYLSHLITQHPGSSSVFLGSAVSYSYDLKKIMLGVSESTLNTFGAVSEETINEMVNGVITNYKSDYAVAVSGIAGPGGGTVDKPVGTVWIAVANKTKVIAKKFQFGQQRTQNIERSATNALILLFKLLKEDQNL